MKIRIKPYEELSKSFTPDANFYHEGMVRHCGKVIEVQQKDLPFPGAMIAEGWQWYREWYDIVEED